jgi:hypothetical protein
VETRKTLAIDLDEQHEVTLDSMARAISSARNAGAPGEARVATAYLMPLGGTPSLHLNWTEVASR